MGSVGGSDEKILVILLIIQCEYRFVINYSVAEKFRKVQLVLKGVGYNYR